MRLRRWPNTDPAFGDCLVFAGKSPFVQCPLFAGIETPPTGHTTLLALIQRCTTSCAPYNTLIVPPYVNLFLWAIIWVAWGYALTPSPMVYPTKNS